MSTSFWSRLEKDPYRLFFPMGALLAFAGVLPWVVQYFTRASYPRDIHQVLMINGFLLSFVCGFLMTAVPRFTGAPQASRVEISIVAIFVLLASLGAWSPNQELNFASAAFAIAALAFFALRRFLQKTSNPPYTFVFIGLGILLWLISNLGLFAVSTGVIDSSQYWKVIFQDLFSNGAIMSLILGVGGRLVPGILGWQEIVSHQRKQYETPAPFLKLVPKPIWFAVLIFLLSFVLRAVIPLQLCLLMRFSVVLSFAVKYWVIYRLPPTRSFLTWSLWICCWCLVLGYLMPMLWIDAGVHAMHGLFIAGFSLLILLISMRVTFAHSVGTEIEKRTPAIFIFTGLILLAMLTRVTAILWPTTYLDHLGFAAMIWIAALCVWGFALANKKAQPI